ncbi:hypothetical protein [Haloglomus litoreum]|uniref:hypothetical protein n=1 Tax=Haloglomus litoreum TaxID=3034026 RepID=UPI0023E798A6|nr:hypothetical protein [Haloglomus sp. DT116]
MGTHETVTFRTDMTAHEVAANWPADDLTWMRNARHHDGAFSCLLTSHVGREPEALAAALLDGFPSVERVAWTQLQNTEDACLAVVYERPPPHEADAVDAWRVLRVASGPFYWDLARDAVREQTGIPVQTWYEITDGDSDIRTMPREETPY